MRTCECLFSSPFILYNKKIFNNVIEKAVEQVLEEDGRKIVLEAAEETLKEEGDTMNNFDVLFLKFQKDIANLLDTIIVDINKFKRV